MCLKKSKQSNNMDFCGAHTTRVNFRSEFTFNVHQRRPRKLNQLEDKKLFHIPNFVFLEKKNYGKFHYSNHVIWFTAHTMVEHSSRDFIKRKASKKLSRAALGSPSRSPQISFRDKTFFRQQGSVLAKN